MLAEGLPARQPQKQVPAGAAAAAAADCAPAGFVAAAQLGLQMLLLMMPCPQVLLLPLLLH